MEAKKPKITDKDIDAAVERVMAGKEATAGSLEEILKVNAEAMKRIADQSVPSTVKAELARLDKEYEDPYVLIKDKIGVLTVSTVDLASIDGWPGYIDEDIVGQYTKQGLQKRIRIPVEINYEPSLERQYTFMVMDKKDYDELAVSSPGGTIPRASMIGAMTLRAGDGRQ